MEEIDGEVISWSESGDGARAGKGGLEVSEDKVERMVGTYHLGTMGAKPTSCAFCD